MLKGILPAISTCFKKDGDINPEAQKRVIRFAIMAGADGIVFPGVASEYNFLSADERAELIRLLVNEVNGSIPLVGGISAPEPAEVISLGQEAIQHGIRRLMLMAPTHLGNEITKHQSFFTQVAEGLPGCEIILQNAPSPIGAGLEADLIIEIIKKNPAITYIKEETMPSGPRITAFLKHAIPHLVGVFGGAGARYIVDELNRGALGAVPAVEITDLHAALYKAHQSGDDRRTRELYQLSLPLLTAQEIYRMRMTKYVLHKRGIVDALYVRAPLPELDAHALRDIDQMLEDLHRAKALTWRE